MGDGLRFALTVAAALGCGLMAGVFFAFSVSVMRALARRPPAEGIAAMQAINIAILNPVFLAVFLGTAAACAVLAVSAVLRWDQPGAVYQLAGGVLYLAGGFLLTAGFHVPRNNALAAVSPADPASAALWADYLSRWTAWNHVRAAASLMAAAALTLALASPPG